MASKSAKFDQNGVKVSIFLLKNRKNCPAAGGFTPRPPFTVTKYLLTMPVCDTLELHQFVQHGGYYAVFVQKKKKKKQLLLHPS